MVALEKSGGWLVGEVNLITEPICPIPSHRRRRRRWPVLARGSEKRRTRWRRKKNGARDAGRGRVWVDLVAASALACRVGAPINTPQVGHIIFYLH